MTENVKVEIAVQPIKKIVIFQCTEFSIEEFNKRIELMAKSGQPVLLNWAEGMVFLPVPYHPDSEVITKYALKGTIFWSALMFSSMPKYQPIKKFGALEIPVVNQTSIPYFRQVALWLKNKRNI